MLTREGKLKRAVSLMQRILCDESRPICPRCGHGGSKPFDPERVLTLPDGKEYKFSDLAYHAELEWREAEHRKFVRKREWQRKHWLRHWLNESLDHGVLAYLLFSLILLSPFWLSLLLATWLFD